MSIRRALITGGGGQLASDLEEMLSISAAVGAPSRVQLDITDDGAVSRALERWSPDTVFNCAAFHNVELCEREEDQAFAVNARAVKRLAQRCAENGAKLVHLSTNYVFDGRRPEPYGEHDLPSPRSTYAISKLAGEHAALAYEPRALVVRSAGLYGLRGSASKGGNFVVRMLAAAEDRGRLRMVADQRLNPTFTADLARAIIAAVEKALTGVVHLTNSQACSWHEFTQEIMDLAGVDVPIEAVSTTRAPGAAERPLNGVLASTVATSAGLQPMRPWREALGHYMAAAGSLAEPVR